MPKKQISKVRKKPGLAQVSKERVREIGAMGGRAVPAAKRSYSLDRKLASDSGKVGGTRQLYEERNFSHNLQSASLAGYARHNKELP